MLLCGSMIANVISILHTNTYACDIENFFCVDALYRTHNIYMYNRIWNRHALDYIQRKYIIAYSILMKMSTQHAFPSYSTEYYSFELLSREKEREEMHYQKRHFMRCMNKTMKCTHTHTLACILNAAHFVLRVWMLHMVHTPVPYPDEYSPYFNNNNSF